LKYKNIDLTELPFYNVSEDAAKSFIDYRKEIKKPLTQRSFNMALREAVLCGQLGMSPDDALDKTQLWGWQAPNYAYTVSKMQNEFKALAVTSQQRICDSTGSLKTTRDRTVLEDLTDRSWAE
jgi:N-acyl-D-aspartate/D-glutamate deacylase